MILDLRGIGGSKERPAAYFQPRRNLKLYWKALEERNQFLLYVET
jgi:hypothetical protein